MGERTWGRQYRETVVCIDAYNNGVPSGTIYNPYLSEPKPFHGVMRFLKETDRMLNDMNLPQSFTETRTFGAPSFTKETNTAARETVRIDGKLATFSIIIIFRQNASWQGTVTWLDKGREESFRSVLELIMLMDSALCSAQ